MKKETMIKGYALVILSAFLFGCMPLITRYIYADGVNETSMVFLRNLLALPPLALLAWREEKSFKIPTKAVPAMTALALLGNCATALLLYCSSQYIPTGTASVFHYVYPAVVVLLGVVFLRMEIQAGALLAIGMCVVGIGLFYDPEVTLDWGGCALALGSGVCYAIYIVILAAFPYKEITSFKLNFYITAICTVIMLIVCLVSGGLTLPSSLTGWLLCILLAVTMSVGAVVMFQQGTFLIGGERASVLSTVEPLTGLVIGLLVFHEETTPGMLVGSALVIAACILIAVFDKKRLES